MNEVASRRYQDKHKSSSRLTGSSSRLTGTWESSINRLATYTTCQRDLRVLNMSDSPGWWTKSFTPQTNCEPLKKDKSHSRFINSTWPVQSPFTRHILTTVPQRSGDVVRKSGHYKFITLSTLWNRPQPSPTLCYIWLYIYCFTPQLTFLTQMYCI